MKVSVIVPAYNAQRYLRETLDCLLAQGVRGTEIIVVNDGSTDFTAAILEQYAAQHSEIMPVYQQNAGVSAARNHGLSLAKGEYVLFLDSDDVLTPGSLRAMSETLDACGADLAICRLESFGHGGSQANPYAEKLAQKEVIEPDDLDLLWNFLVGNKLYRRATLLASGAQFPPLRYSEEGAFFMRFVLSPQRPRIVGVQNACMCYRRHTPEEGQSVSQSINLLLLQDFLSSLSIVYDSAAQAGKSHTYLQEVLYKTDYILISQFYRLLWRADEETLACIAREHGSLLSRMDEQTRGRVKALHDDLPELVCSKAEIAQKPLLSVICKHAGAQRLADIYLQSMPQFELLLPHSQREKLPAYAREASNLVLLPDKGFRRQARLHAKARLRLHLSGNRPLDERLFRLMLRLPLPEPVKRLLPLLVRPLYWGCLWLLHHR